jgi:predicted Rossmann fold nucleotide-binding protein DprA/Smf involved in DNA uptake
MSHEDILDYFSLVSRHFTRKDPPPGKKAGRVYRSLSLVPCSADDISARTGLSVQDVIMELTDLEMDGLITCLGKNQYILRV